MKYTVFNDKLFKNVTFDELVAHYTTMAKNELMKNGEKGLQYAIHEAISTASAWRETINEEKK